jgi:hypothetical protein
MTVVHLWYGLVISFIPMRHTDRYHSKHHKLLLLARMWLFSSIQTAVHTWPAQDFVWAHGPDDSTGAVPAAKEVCRCLIGRQDWEHQDSKAGFHFLKFQDGALHLT